MSNIDKQELREAAERAESDSWGYDRDEFNDAITPEVVLALLDELEAAHELVELQRFKLERQAEDLHQAKSLESIHREKRFEVEREYSDYKHRAESNSMRLAKEVCLLEDALKAAGIRIEGED
ncbi:TPA: ead/Ea22-like family protein [Enterobacter hormaechei]|nr:ead/Ea22-like family protein [Enterobacter hormaechei]HAS1712570.1 ead/Ea22-like family protein [Enterobacter hormaechei]HAS1715532.1 ead/Ea22-like family protein [Enterobacter hormaechei]